MRILLLGGNGMAGHVLVSYLSRQAGYEVEATVRTTNGQSFGQGTGQPALPKPCEIPLHELDARDLPAAMRTVERVRPDVIVNAIGVLNRNAEEHPLLAYTVNGLLPHWLAHVASEIGARLIHISSDCVFSGSRGSYGEEERPDGHTVYALSKALGEVRNPRHLTLRTSIIGPEIREDGIGLLKWFLDQRGAVPGYENVLWNGVTTLELAKAVAWAIENPETGGLVHLTAPSPISKHKLLEQIRQAYGREDLEVRPTPEPILDRTLLPTKSAFGFKTAAYPDMLAELAEWERALWQ